MDNGKTLRELKFKTNETITAFKNTNVLVTVEPIVNEDGDFNEKTYEILRKLFLIYAEDDEEKGVKVIHPTHMARFIRKCLSDRC